MGELSATSATGSTEILDSAFPLADRSVSPGFRPTGGLFLAALFLGQFMPAFDETLESFSGNSAPGATLVSAPSTWTSSLSGTFAYAKLYMAPTLAYGFEAEPGPTRRRLAPVTEPAEELRQLTTLPVENLAQLIGVSRVAYHDWLRGRPIALQRERLLLQVLSVVREAGRYRDAPALRRWLIEPVSGTDVTPFALLAAGRFDEVVGLAYQSTALPTTSGRAQLDDAIEAELGVPFNRRQRVVSRGWTEGQRQPRYLAERHLSRGWQELPTPAARKIERYVEHHA